jgi:hypothetical protein
MNNFATFDDPDSSRQPLDEGMILRPASALTGKTVFLAHSPKHERFLPGLISVLENHGGWVCIDKEDGRLPESINRETAETRRATINECEGLFYLFNEQQRSKSVPWELGIADREKGYIPVLYPRQPIIVMSKDGLSKNIWASAAELSGLK